MKRILPGCPEGVFRSGGLSIDLLCVSGDGLEETERELRFSFKETCVVGQGVECCVGVVSDVGCGRAFQQHV